MTETLERIQLPPGEINNLSESVRDKIKAAFPSDGEANGNWVLVGAENAKAAKAIDRAMDLYRLMFFTNRNVSREHDINQLIEIFSDNALSSKSDVKIPFEFEMAIRNARRRAEYVARTKLLTTEDVCGQSGFKNTNKSPSASQWKKAGKIFSLHWANNDLYPEFQFKNGKPRPVIKKILEKVADEFSPWQIAFWFESGNGWLGGDEPQDCLDNFNEVVWAAERSVRSAIG